MWLDDNALCKGFPDVSRELRIHDDPTYFTKHPEFQARIEQLNKMESILNGYKDRLSEKTFVMLLEDFKFGVHKLKQSKDALNTFTDVKLKLLSDRMKDIVERGNNGEKFDGVDLMRGLTEL
ncbi:unnamed protein product [Ambrosiozyma monospora]|uniref:Unnamed protein product n=1 Tax=Ambrosiozyma monospora TaxID=43982 RepID=A0ACB5U150_AMBMO|nr:unnamed protein product [Ambrosiozyma monospora]